MIASMLAILVANSAWASWSHTFLHRALGGLSVEQWINDVLMSLFFLGVGLDIKAELYHGQLATARARILPGLAALGGMIVPAMIFSAITWHEPTLRSGWAIPSATDIAFALGVITLLGRCVPPSLRAFLAALAIIDDLGAIIIIALFYTEALAWPMLLGVVASLGLLIGLNRCRVDKLWPYLIIGSLLWVCMFHSGLHATLAGVLLAFCIPLRSTDLRPAALHRLQRRLAPWVAFGVLPLFGLANAGVVLDIAALGQLFSPLPVAIVLGLVIGKPVGIFGTAWLAIRSGWAPMPAGARWYTLLATAQLCGIGFTMSLFIGGLAYSADSPAMAAVRMGVLVGSIISTLLGVIAFRRQPSGDTGMP